MAPRRYDARGRARMQEATRLRILDATVALHAEKGAVATSYADIAARADVAVPTVYKHFPTRESLLRGCTSHAARHAPFVGAEVFAGLPEPLDRFGALVAALYARHAYMEPWLRWAEHRVDPALSVLVAQMEREVADLIVEALTRGRHRPGKSAVALAVALCAYPAWEAMVRHQGLAAREAARVAVTSVAALLSTTSQRAQR